MRGSPKRVDGNQAEITEEVRQVGATVQDLHMVGDGFPDILVGYRGRNWLFEIKMRGGKLNDNEQDWHRDWRGQVHVAETSQQIINIITAPEW